MSRRLLAIDPGNIESAYVIIDEDRRPNAFGKIDNDALMQVLDDEVLDFTNCVIEMISSYGMTVGAEVFETVYWIGRFSERTRHVKGYLPVLVKRIPIKIHHCKSAKAKDGNITQALVDRFTPGQANFGKGTKANPGWFHGFSGDIWQAYALAVYAMDVSEGVEV